MLLERPVQIPQAGDKVVEGDLVVPEGATGIVVFAHGSGSGRHSPRNRQVAASLVERGLATLLMDLLTLDEEAVDLQTRHLRFDITLLATRLAGAASWLAEEPATRGLRLGYFGASTGAAAALLAAARQPEGVATVVSRGGRPDLAGDALPEVEAPTLLLVGSLDHQVIELNRHAQGRMRAPCKLMIIEGASHLFEEPGTLEEVARLAGEWFSRRLGSLQPWIEKTR